MAKEKSNSEKDEIRITGVPPKMHEEISNIADHAGVTLAQFLRPKIREIINSYPEHMRKPAPKD